MFQSFVTNEITSDDSSSNAATLIYGYTKSGTGTTAVSNGANLFGLKNVNDTVFLVKGDGDIHATNTTITALDDEDDIALVEASKWAMASQDDRQYKMDKKQFGRLQELGIFNEAGDMWNMQKMTTLQLGAMGQMMNVIRGLAARLGLSDDEIYKLSKQY